MNRAELAAHVAAETSVTKAAAAPMVKAVFSAIGDALARDQTLAIAVFGTCTVLRGNWCRPVFSPSHSRGGHQSRSTDSQRSWSAGAVAIPSERQPCEDARRGRPSSRGSRCDEPLRPPGLVPPLRTAASESNRGRHHPAFAPYAGESGVSRRLDIHPSRQTGHHICGRESSRTEWTCCRLRIHAHNLPPTTCPHEPILSTYQAHDRSTHDCDPSVTDTLPFRLRSGFTHNPTPSKHWSSKGIRSHWSASLS